jgi:hypothetical protein
LVWDSSSSRSSLFAQTQSDYYRIETYELPKGVNFEASGLAVTDKGKLAVGLRKGEVWIEGKDGFQLFASGCMRSSASRGMMERFTRRSVRR